MFYLDENHDPKVDVFYSLEKLEFLPDNTQTRKIIDILKNALDSNNKSTLYYRVKFSQKRVLYQILKDEKLKKNKELTDFFKKITEDFLSDLEKIDESKLSKLKQAFRNLLDLIIVKSLELKTQNENRQTPNQNYGSNRSSHWGGQRRRF